MSIFLSEIWVPLHRLQCVSQFGDPGESTGGVRSDGTELHVNEGSTPRP